MAVDPSDFPVFAHHFNILVRSPGFADGDQVCRRRWSADRTGPDRGRGFSRPCTHFPGNSREAIKQTGESVAITDDSLTINLRSFSTRVAGSLATSLVTFVPIPSKRTVLARYEDGGPALVEGRAVGRVLLFTSSLGQAGMICH